MVQLSAPSSLQAPDLSPKKARHKNRVIVKNTTVSEDEIYNEKHPLNLPRGSVRAIVFLFVTFVLGASFVIEHEIPSELRMAWSMLASYYLGTRSAD